MIPQEALVADVMTEEVRCCRETDTVEQVMDADGRRPGAPPAGARRATARSSASSPSATWRRDNRPHTDETLREISTPDQLKSPNAPAALPERQRSSARRRSTSCAIPGRFAWRTLKAFRANQGLLLAGAVAYYALLSIVPLLILTVIALSHLIDQARAAAARSAATSSGWCRASRRRSSRELAQLPRQPRRRSAGCCSRR